MAAFCKKCLKEEPRFIESIAHCGPATIHLIYKYREDKNRYAEMYLLFMEHPKGNVGWNDFGEIRHMTYEQIRTDRNSILIK